MNPPTPHKKPTLDDVARLAGVAKSTASLVLAGDDAKRNVRPARRAAVEEAARQLGFEVNPHARHLSRGGQRNTIAIFSIGLDLGVGTRKIDYVQAELSQRGFDVPIFTYGYSGADEGFDQVRLMNNLCRQQPRAIVCTSTSGLHAETISALKRYIESGGLVITYDHAIDLECDQVIFDRGHSTYTSTRYLLELGHRKLALVAEARLPEDERINNFYQALIDFGLPKEAGQILITPREEDGGIELASRYMKLEEPPTGLAIINDRSAAAFVNALVRANVRVPEAVSVISHDDLPTARACVVPLTAVAQPMQQIAATVAQFVLSRVEGTYEGTARRESIKGELKIRQSTARYVLEHISK